MLTHTYTNPYLRGRTDRVGVSRWVRLEARHPRPVKILSGQQAWGPLSTSQGNKAFLSLQGLCALQQSHLPETSLFTPHFMYPLSCQITSATIGSQARRPDLSLWAQSLAPALLPQWSWKNHWKCKARRVDPRFSGGRWMGLDKVSCRRG